MATTPLYNFESSLPDLHKRKTKFNKLKQRGLTLHLPSGQEGQVERQDGQHREHDWRQVDEEVLKEEQLLLSAKVSRNEETLTAKVSKAKMSVRSGAITEQPVAATKMLMSEGGVWNAHAYSGRGHRWH